MKNRITYIFIAFVTINLISCNNLPVLQTTSMNQDSVKAVIINIQNKMLAASSNPSNYESYCEDSMLSMYDREFTTSAYSLSHDLSSGILVPPHNYEFRLFGYTAILTFLQTFYEVINSDSVFHNVRVMKTFVFNNGQWKQASICTSSQQENYFKPVADIHRNEYNEYSGVYKWKDGALDTVFVKDGKLYDKFPNEQPALNYPVSDSEYMVKHDLGRIVYKKDKNGKVAYYTFIRSDGQRIRIPKLK